MFCKAEQASSIGVLEEEEGGVLIGFLLSIAKQAVEFTQLGIYRLVPLNYSDRTMHICY